MSVRAVSAALLDANVIAVFELYDLILRLSTGPKLLLPKWTDAILDEATRTYTQKLKRKWTLDRVESMFREANRVFPEARISGFETLIDVCTNQSKDRHVLAAAIKGHVQTIVTFNLRDFREPDLEPWGVVAVHPSEYLISRFDLSPGIVVERLNEIATIRGLSPEQVVTRLGKRVPEFARTVANELGWSFDERI